MKFRIQVVRVADDGAERMKEVMEFERQELAMETLGMSLAEGKSHAQGSAGVCGRTAGRGVSATGANLPALRQASVEQRRRFDSSADGVWDSAVAESALESV
jgi:hypothetical protein